MANTEPMKLENKGTSKW